MATHNPIAAWDGGIVQPVQLALSASGLAWRRARVRGPYGYRWTTWQPASRMDPKNPPAVAESGWDTLYPMHGEYWRRFRLPG